MQVRHWIMNQIIPGACCHLLVILAAFFAFLTWSKVFSALHFASVILTALSAASSVSFPVFVILCFDYNSLFLSASLFSLLSSDSSGLSECSCDSVALRQKVAALWMWGKEKRKRLLPDCPGTKKETLFSFPTWPMRKKMQEGGKECWGRGWGNCWAQCKEVELFSLETCLKGWAEAWKFSQSKIFNLPVKKKQEKSNKIQQKRKGWIPG